jgi:hypothetical protein
LFRYLEIRPIRRLAREVDDRAEEFLPKRFTASAKLRTDDRNPVSGGIASLGWESSMNLNKVVPERGDPTTIGMAWALDMTLLLLDDLVNARDQPLHLVGRGVAGTAGSHDPVF